MNERYAVIKDGVVENVIVWDGVAPYDPGPDVVLVQAPPARVGPGWRYEAGEFIPPDPPIEV